MEIMFNIPASLMAILSGSIALTALVWAVQKNRPLYSIFFFALAPLCYYYSQAPSDFETVVRFGRPLAAILYLSILLYIIFNEAIYGEH